jgi:hypothetical protein
MGLEDEFESRKRSYFQSELSDHEALNYC